MVGTVSAVSGTLRPRTVTIFMPGWRNSDAVSRAAVTHAAGIVAKVEHQAGKTVAAQLFDGLLDLGAGVAVEAGNPDVADAGGQEEGAVHARRLHVFGRQHQPHHAVRAGTAHIELCLLLPRLREQLR